MLLISGVLVGCNRDEVEAPRAQVPATSRPSAPVPSSSAAAHPAVVVTRPLRLAGKVSFGEDYYSKLASPVQGRVVEVRAALGQAVKDGQVLLVIDSPDITAAYANFLKETSELQFATRAHTLAQDLYETKALALKDLKQAENDLIKEQAEYHQAKERLLALKVPRSELEKPLGQQKDLGRFELKSPLTGTVVDRTVTPGTWVGTDPAQVLLTVADLDRLQMVAEVYEQDLPLIHVGAPAVVTVEAYPGEVFPAVVASIGDLVDRDTRTVKIRAWLNNDAHKLKPEMYARLNLGKS
jgi:cobalt-zinc-cadmium efflux system membrane fusion protein